MLEFGAARAVSLDTMARLIGLLGKVAARSFDHLWYRKFAPQRTPDAL
jgi:hypothetical protein